MKMNPEIKQTPSLYLELVADCRGKVREITSKINVIIENSLPKTSNAATPEICTRTLLEDSLVSLLKDLENLKNSIIA